MDYPKTDDDWVKLAECIVTKDPGISPEVVGALSVDATTTIFSWFEGEERRRALVTRQYGRDRMIELGKQTGCLEEREELRLGERMIEVPLGREEQHYWEVTNMVSGEILQEGISYRTIAEAVNEAQFSMDTKYTYFGDNHLVIKIFDKSPFDRAGRTFEPEYTESYWIEGAQKRVSETAGRPLYAEPAGRPVPQTYGDWVTLAMDIKETAGIDDFETTADVNRHLEHIYKEEETEPGVVRESKMWLVRKAGDLGIK